MSAQTLGFAVQAEDRPVLDELVAYFGDGNGSGLPAGHPQGHEVDHDRRPAQGGAAYGQQRAAELGIDPPDMAARVQEFLKATPEGARR